MNEILNDLDGFEEIEIPDTTPNSFDELIQIVGIGGAQSIIECCGSAEQALKTFDGVLPIEPFFEEKTFRFDRVARYLIRRHNVCKIDGTLHFYRNGLYLSGEQNFHGLLLMHFPTMTDNKRREVIKYLSSSFEVPIKQVCPPEFIPLGSKIFDISSGLQFSYTPDFPFLSRLPWDFRPDAPAAEMVDKVIDGLCGGDVEKRELLLELIGNALYRANIFRGAAFLYNSVGANGKSTFLNMLCQFFGRDNCSFLSLKDTNEKFRLMEIYGKFVNLGDDISGDFLSDAAIFKKLVTGETIIAENKGETPVSFRPYAKLFFSLNTLPSIGDRSAALFDRIIIFPLTKSYKGGERDISLKDRIWTRGEMEYLMRLAVEGLQRLLKRGDFVRPKSCQTALQEFELENNPISSFLEEYPDRDRINGAPTSLVYKDYSEWCLSAGYKALSRNRFTREISNALNLETKLSRHPYFGQRAGRVFIEKL